MPRPSLPKSARRVPINARVSPETADTIKDAQKALDLGQGEALDHIATEARRAAVLRRLVGEMTTREHINHVLGRLPTPEELDAIDPAGGDEAADH
jgi:hypothetical protein